MKFKTSIIAFLICIFQLFSLFSVSADSADVITDITDYSVVVSGDLSTGRAKTDLILRMKDSDGNDILAEFTTSWFKNDEVVFEFDKILLPKNLTSGEYTFEITGEEILLPIVIDYEYVGPDRVLDILTIVRDADSVADVLADNSDDLSLDISDYGLLTDEGQILFEDVMAQVEYDLPEGYVSDEDREKIKKETEKFLAAYDNAICLSLFESIEDEDDVSAWVERYYGALGFDTEDDATEYSEEKITSYLNTVKESETFTDKLTAAEGLDTTDEIKAYLYESALLSVIAEQRSSVVKDMMLQFPELFEIDEDALGDLSVSKQSTCFTNITGNVYDSYEDAAEALNDEIDDASDTPRKGSSGGGGSGGGGGGGSIAIGTTTPVVDNSEKTEEAKIEFSDITSNHWAYDAVQKLCQRRIISGRGDGTFAPDANVTRAEFIKMITVAMSLKSNGTDTPFSDVSSDAWYAPYVAMAYKEGIVIGDDGRFNPDANITRQDMVTILYRAMKIAEQNTELSFTDAGEISEYAKDAVAYFSKKGIVNGMGDGSFAPRANATRAQAAKILYNIITS